MAFLGGRRTLWGPVVGAAACGAGALHAAASNTLTPTPSRRLSE